MKILFTLTIIAIITAIVCGIIGMGWLITTSVSLAAFLLLVLYSEVEMSTRHSLNLFNHQTGVKLTSFQRNMVRIFERRIPYLVLSFVVGIIILFTWIFRISIVIVAVGFVWLLISFIF